MNSTTSKTLPHVQILRKSGRILFSAASLVAGILVAVLLQAVISSVFDNL